jgi:hypothetical protein
MEDYDKEALDNLGFYNVVRIHIPMFMTKFHMQMMKIVVQICF